MLTARRMLVGGGQIPANTVPPVITSGSPPANTAVPTVSGTAQQGQVLTASTGTWTNSPTSYAYQWQTSANGTSGWANLTGATSSTYTAQAGDVGNYLRVQVTATNASGSNAASSAATSQVTAAPTGYSATILAESGLVSYWRLDEASGTSAADSKGANTGTYSGITLGQPGALVGDSDTAIKFATAGDASHNVQVADAASLNFSGSFSLECWFKTPSSGTQYIIGKGFASNGNPWDEWILGLNGSTFPTFALATSDSTFSQINASSAPSLNAWHHLVGVFTSATKMEVFLDGVSVASTTLANAAVAHFAQPVTFGCTDRGGSYVSGVPSAFLLDEVAVYNVALTSTQVANHYSAGIA